MKKKTLLSPLVVQVPTGSKQDALRKRKALHRPMDFSLAARFFLPRPWEF